MADARKKILIVDDEVDIRVFLETLFRDNGYDTVCAENGDQGMQVLRSEKVDLVTLDLQMPGETGTQLYRRMHRDNDLASIPVIVISGVAGRHLAVREPHAVFDKPIDKDELIESIREAIG